MNRRRFLATFTTVGGLPTYWYGTRSPRRSVEIRYWLSPQAGRYDVRTSIAEYVDAALAPVFDVDLSYGGIAPVLEEHGYRVTRNGEWPQRLYSRYHSSSDVEPVEDVNLLVTDGTMRHGPTGLAKGRLASIGGARHLADLPPRDEIDDVVGYRRPFFVMHVLIHEIGHVLGLEHEHGHIETTGGNTVVTPMVSTYAWSDQRNRFAGDYCVCGTPYPDPGTGQRHLSFSFSECAHEALSSYRGGLVL